MLICLTMIMASPGWLIKSVTTCLKQRHAMEWLYVIPVLSLSTSASCIVYRLLPICCLSVKIQNIGETEDSSLKIVRKQKKTRKWNCSFKRPLMKKKADKLTGSLKILGHPRSTNSLVWAALRARFRLSKKIISDWTDKREQIQTQVYIFSFFINYLLFLRIIYSTTLKDKKTVRWFTPSHPNISMHILNTFLCTFSNKPARRICLTIIRFFS